MPNLSYEPPSDLSVRGDNVLLSPVRSCSIGGSSLASAGSRTALYSCDLRFYAYRLERPRVPLFDFDEVFTRELRVVGRERVAPLLLLALRVCPGIAALLSIASPDLLPTLHIHSAAVH